MYGMKNVFRNNIITIHEKFNMLWKAVDAHRLNITDCNQYTCKMFVCQCVVGKFHKQPSHCANIRPSSASKAAVAGEQRTYYSPL